MLVYSSTYTNRVDLTSVYLRNFDKNVTVASYDWEMGVCTVVITLVPPVLILNTTFL